MLGVIMNLREITYTKIKYWVFYTEISENKAAVFFYRWKQNENHHAEILEDPC